MKYLLLHGLCMDSKALILSGASLHIQEMGEWDDWIIAPFPMNGHATVEPIYSD